MTLFLALLLAQTGRLHLFPTLTAHSNRLREGIPWLPSPFPRPLANPNIPVTRGQPQHLQEMFRL